MKSKKKTQKKKKKKKNRYFLKRKKKKKTTKPLQLKQKKPFSFFYINIKRLKVVEFWELYVSYNILSFTYSENYFHQQGK